MATRRSSTSYSKAAMARRKLGVKPSWLTKAEESRRPPGKFLAKTASTEWTNDLTTEYVDATVFGDTTKTFIALGTAVSSGTPIKISGAKITGSTAGMPASAYSGWPSGMTGSGTITFLPFEDAALPQISRPDLERLADELVKERYPDYRP